ncbi:MAG: Si-specific NAD(P)(+) transhydrogenase [Phycisphaerales bacterium]
MPHSYDLCVIGSGPAGQKAAVQAAKLGKRVCIIERREVVGGVAINTGTIPSKALREAILHLTTFKQPTRSINGIVNNPRQNPISIEDLTYWCQQVIGHEIDIVRNQLLRNSVEIRTGSGSLVDKHTVQIRHGNETENINAEHIFIATGTKPAHPDSIPFDTTHILDADAILNIPKLPRTLIVVGGGVIGTEYASMIQALGVKVTLVDKGQRLLSFLDDEIAEALQYHLRQNGMTLRLAEEVVSIRKVEATDRAAARDEHIVEVHLESGKVLRAEALLYAVGRQGCTDELGLENVHLAADSRGRIKVNEHYQTEVPNIYAGGDVIGFPALASTSMEQGRLAACHMFNYQKDRNPDLFPFGIYAIPEISMVGWNEEQLTEQDIPFESGIANYREIARGQLLGDLIGMLKILVHQETRQILGVHCIGTGATELIHIGQAVMALKGTVDYFINTVFNYPTLAECYKVAALNASNKLAFR